MNHDKESLKLPAVCCDEDVSIKCKDDDMNVALVQPTIIQCVFKFLSPIDVHHCRLVCRAWYIEALRCLKKCPAIETFMEASGYVRKKMKFLKAKGKPGILMESVSKDFGVDAILYSPWGFFLNRDGCKISSIVGSYTFKEDRLSEISQDKSGCVSSFSLISCDCGLYHHQLSPSPISPAVFLRSNCSFKESESRIYKALGNSVGTPDLYQSMIHAGMETGFKNHSKLIVKFHGFRLNRYISHHKVIITDHRRLPGETPFPNPDDPKYPIRAVIILSANDRRSHELAKVFEKFSEGSSFDVTDVSVGRDIWYHDVHFEGFRESKVISITFAGKDVASAVWEMEYVGEPSISEVSANIRGFKENLGFPVDDRVIGFFCFSRDWDTGSVYSDILSLIDEQFPRIKHSFFPFAVDYKPNLRLHLIRI